MQVRAIGEWGARQGQAEWPGGEAMRIRAEWLPVVCLRVIVSWPGRRVLGNGRNPILAGGRRQAASDRKVECGRRVVQYTPGRKVVNSYLIERAWLYIVCCIAPYTAVYR